MAPASAKGVKGAPSKSDKIPKQSLFDDSSSSSEDDQEDGGATLGPAATAAQLKINEDYARKFEHNKKREELHRLQEKYGVNGDAPSESSSEDESEDDEAVLITEDLDAEISATLAAIKNKDPRIYDKDAVFYKPFDPAAAEKEKEKKEKPIFLKDYHRERYMAGDVGADEDNSAGPQVLRTYVQEQADLKNAILSEINAAAGADEEEEWSDDDAFIKPAKKDDAPAPNGVHPSRRANVELTEVDVKNADKDPEEFLSKFMASKAWAPPEGSNWQAFESDDGEDNDDIADEFEHAYNMRFEDPTKSNEFLSTYSRNMANARSARKETLTGRKRLRALEKEKKEAEKKQREEDRARLRQLKVNEASDKLAKIKAAAGLSGKNFTNEEWLKLLDDAWDDEKWEEEMKKRFDDSYYAEADDAFRGADDDEDDDEDEEEGSGDEDKKKKKKKPRKPKWDDDIDIKDIVPDFIDDDEVKPEVLLSDEDLQPAAAASSDGSGDLEDSDSDRPSKKRKTTKDLKKEKIAAKRQAAAERAKIEALVDTKMEIDEPRALASKKEKESFGFRYRETSPTSFGLTARDILLAPSDAVLNEFAGLKKLAPFREADKKRKDKKKLGKKARLRQWRRDTFGKSYEETGPTYGFEGLLADAEEAKKERTRGSGANAVKTHKPAPAPAAEAAKPNADGIVEGERKKKRKRSKNKVKKPGVEIEAGE